MLTSFHIKNFRSCKDVKLEDMGPMLGLVGRNGAGKTTILRAIEWVASTALFKDQPPRFATVTVLEALAELQARLEMRVDGHDYQYNVRRVVSEHHGPAGRPQHGRHEESLLVRSPGSSHWIDLLARTEETVELPDRRSRVEINRLTAAMPALAALLPKDDALQVHLQRSMMALGNIRCYLGRGLFDPVSWFATDPVGPVSQQSYESWAAGHDELVGNFSSLRYRIIHAQQKTPDIFDELKTMIGPEGLGLLNDISVVALNGGGSRGSGHTRSYYDVVFEPVGQNIELSLDQLSGGTRQLLYLMLVLLFDQSSTMLIEQPEDGVHPALLSKLIDIFKVNSDPAQIIFTSHSPTVLSSLEPADVRLVEMRGGSTRVRALTAAEVSRAQSYMQREGSLAEFIELIQED